MSSLMDTMKYMVDQIKGLQERLNIMDSEQSPAISSLQSIPASTCQATPSASGNWRDAYHPFGPSMLDPHNTGASTAEYNISMAQTSVSFAS